MYKDSELWFAAPTDLNLFKKFFHTGGNQRSQCTKVMEEVKKFQDGTGVHSFGLDGQPPQGCPFTAGVIKNGYVKIGLN